MGNALKILAVDDEPSIAESMHYIFDDPRYEVTSAADGNYALDQVDAHPGSFHVVITDSRMPRVSGLDFVKKLRERSFTGKILVLSAFLNAEVRTAFEQMSVDTIVEKPFSVAGLRAAVDSLVAAQP